MTVSCVLCDKIRCILPSTSPPSRCEISLDDGRYLFEHTKNACHVLERREELIKGTFWILKISRMPKLHVATNCIESNASPIC